MSEASSFYTGMFCFGLILPQFVLRVREFQEVVPRPTADCPRVDTPHRGANFDCPDEQGYWYGNDASRAL